MYRINLSLSRLIKKPNSFINPLLNRLLSSEINEDKLKDYIKQFEAPKSGPGKSYFRVLNDQLLQRNSLLENMRSLSEMKSKNTDKEMVELIDLEWSELEEKISMKDHAVLDSILTLEEGDMFQSMIVEVTAGVGGKEAMLFAGELFEMYSNYCLFKRWELDVLQVDNSDMGGIRHASFCVTGHDAFQYLRHEGGVHRVQRIPVTEKSGRIHTSTVSVAIIPRPDNFEINIKDKDLRIETKRASGAGGQHVNTTDSAVRITHLPSGISVECQTDRSQFKNRDLAMKKLEAKLFEVELEKQKSAEISSRKSQKGQSMRNEKIRTYNFNQDRITDHRIESGTTHNLEGFLAGNHILDKFIDHLQSELKEQKLNEILKNLK